MPPGYLRRLYAALPPTWATRVRLRPVFFSACFAAWRLTPLPLFQPFSSQLRGIIEFDGGVTDVRCRARDAGPRFLSPPLLASHARGC